MVTGNTHTKWKQKLGEKANTQVWGPRQPDPLAGGCGDEHAPLEEGSVPSVAQEALLQEGMLRNYFPEACATDTVAPELWDNLDTDGSEGSVCDHPSLLVNSN